MTTKTKVICPTVQLVKVRDLKPSDWNPGNRISLHRIRSLADSMDRVGQKIPILITSGYSIIEGHRRWAAAKWLEWDYIAAIIDGDTAEHTYAEVNTEVLRLSGNDALKVWLSNQSAVSVKRATEFTKASKSIGKPRLVRIAECGLSLRVYKTAVVICRFCSLPSVGDVVDWLVKFSGTGMIGQIMKAIDSGEGSAAIAKAFKSRTPVKIRLD